MPNTHLKTEHQLRVEELMIRASQNIPCCPKMPDEKTRNLRATLILEESLETIRALGFELKFKHYNEDGSYESVTLNPNEDMELENKYDPSLKDIIDGCADVSVVTIGTASACGVAMSPILKEVDENNLKKFGPGGYRRDDGKWMKPPGHKPPDIDGLIEEQKECLQN
jgi:predicted HAD superfamily Cof-like phosphohydrolase